MRCKTSINFSLSLSLSLSLPLSLSLSNACAHAHTHSFTPQAVTQAHGQLKEPVCCLSDLLKIYAAPCGRLDITKGRTTGEYSSFAQEDNQNLDLLTSDLPK